MSYKLCFVAPSGENKLFLYFTDKFKTQWGDDWRNYSWKDCAGEPYLINDKRDDDYNRDCGHLRVIGVWFYDYDEVDVPDNGYSVEDINNGRVAWLYNKKSGSLMAGATITSAFKYLGKLNCLYSELKQKGSEENEQDDK